MTNMVERFWSKVERRAPDQCWPWRAGIFKRHGYGQFSVSNRSKKAHRVSYELTYGPIPAGLVVRHTCDNRLCVNPAHLLPGTQADNVADRRNRKRTFNLKKTACGRGHPLSGDNLYVNPKGERNCRICQRDAYLRWLARRSAAALNEE